MGVVSARCRMRMHDEFGLQTWCAAACKLHDSDSASESCEMKSKSGVVVALAAAAIVLPHL